MITNNQNQITNLFYSILGHSYIYCSFDLCFISNKKRFFCSYWHCIPNEKMFSFYCEKNIDTRILIMVKTKSVTIFNDNLPDKCYDVEFTDFVTTPTTVTLTVNLPLFIEDILTKIKEPSETL